MTLLRRMATVVALLVALFALAAGTASAHAKLVSTDPADGAILSAPPTSVSFTFDEPLLQGTDTISINDSAGNVIATQSVQPAGAVITAAWPAEATSGMFQVAYRAVSDDGHPVSGAIVVTIAGDGASPAAAAAASASATSDVAPVTDAQPSRSLSGTLVIIIGIVVLGLIVFAAVRMIRRRSL